MSIVVANQETVENGFGDDKKQTVIRLRELVKENSELKKYREDDDYLTQILYYTSFDVVEAIEKMQLFQNALVKHSTWYALKPPLDVKNLLEYNAICLLDERDKDGRAVILIKLGNMASNTNIEESASIFQLIVEYAYLQKETCENGLCVIVDMENAPWKYLAWLTPGNIKIGVKLITTYPCIDYKIHLVKTSVFLDTAVKILWPILPAHIKQNVLFQFKDWSALHKYVNPECLPSEYGGTAPDLNFIYYNQKLFDNNDQLKERLQYRKAITTKIED